MKEVFGYIVVKKAEFPAFEKAHKLARKMTEDEIDTVLTVKKHIHANPRKKPAEAKEGENNDIQ